MYLTYLCMRNKKYGNYIWFKKRKTLNKKVISFDGTFIRIFLKPIWYIYDKYSRNWIKGKSGKFKEKLDISTISDNVKLKLTKRSVLY
jgi:hypothetical protein